MSRGILLTASGVAANLYWAAIFSASVSPP